MKKIIVSRKLPKPVGPYSQAVKFDNLLFLSGMGAFDASGKLVEGEIEDHVRKTLQNIEVLLKEVGSSLQNVLKVTIFLKNMDDFKRVNKVYAEFFSKDPPARSTVEVSNLPAKMLIEIEVIAYV
ncbi:MAG: RidA family protein [Candidatus Methanofastidiosia archaeon]